MEYNFTCLPSQLKVAVIDFYFVDDEEVCDSLKRLKEIVQVHGFGSNTDSQDQTSSCIERETFQHRASLLPLFDLLALRAQSAILAKVAMPHLHCITEE